MDLLTGLMTGRLQASMSADPANDAVWTDYAVGPMTAAGVKVSPEGARKISAWYRGRDILATSVAMLPFHMYRRLPNGDREPAPNHPLDDILDRKANAGTDSFQFKRQAMCDVIDHGWHYSLIVEGARGFVDQLRRIDPTTVTPEIIVDGPLIGQWKFTVRDPKAPGRPKVYRQDQVFYLRGVDGKGILEYARDSLGLGLTLEHYASKLFSRGAMNGGIIETAGPLPDPEKMRALAMQFKAAYSDWHMPRVLPNGATFKPAMMEPEKAQMILSRQFSVKDFARWLGLPGHMLGESDGAGAANQEQRGQEFVTFSLGGWLALWEFATNDQLVLAARTYYAEFTRDALAQGDLSARWEAYVGGVNAGILTPNEPRRKENLPAIPGLDIPREPQNITGRGAKGGPQDNQRPGRKGDPDARATKIAEASAARLLKLEVTAVQRLAVKHGKDGDAFAAAVTEFYAAHVGRVMEMLLMSEPEASGYCASQSALVLAEWMPALEKFKSEDYAQGLAAWALESEAA